MWHWETSQIFLLDYHSGCQVKNGSGYRTAFVRGYEHCSVCQLVKCRQSFPVRHTFHDGMKLLKSYSMCFSMNIPYFVNKGCLRYCRSVQTNGSHSILSAFHRK